MVITLLSDFGDLYPASMKGVILGIAPDANIVDISHSIPAQDVLAGAFMLAASAKYFPPGTVHIAVVDPGVGTKRRAIAIRAESKNNVIHYFIGPDNGLLIPAAGSIGDFQVFEITNKILYRDADVSATFHGRDIFAPAGAHISKGFEIENVGGQIKDFVALDFGKARRFKDSIEGSIIFIDTFGNIITNIHSEIVDYRPGDVLDIWNERIVFQSSYGLSGEGEPLALIGSHSYLEIAVNRGSAAQFFNKKQGDGLLIKT
ncbi:MAG: S-adenosyl-l-methionine hydroxide adenosyltransferase family protein [Candidatus Methanoperedens sp.]|nr:S-adenosyl-l-methionine hydroxide adenosyltransferase family protein [Candidatus Methanoperedens sp.]PKL54345.1 MAG: hypothetical protein CVV36_02185 [Candidatus Methanoperedenaceae archaeon HGW-Methanoperedenaceae-1]